MNQILVPSISSAELASYLCNLPVNYAHDLRIYTVARNPALEAKIAADVAAFWADMEANVLSEAEPRDTTSWPSSRDRCPTA